MGVILAAILGFVGQDIVNETNYVQVPFAYVCLKTGGKWVNKNMPGAACVGQDDGWLNPKKDEASTDA